MGMFDYVHFEMDCPTCGEKVNSFQSKDSNCFMETIEPDTLQNFYAPCRKCQSWIEFTRGYPSHDKRENPLTLSEITGMGFKMEVKEREK